MTTPFPVALPPLTEQLCRRCAQTKPAEAFRANDSLANRLEPLCFECEKEELAERMRALEKAKQESEFRQLVKHVGNRTNRAPHPAEVVELMLGKFSDPSKGVTGLQGFVDFYYMQLQDAAAIKPGSKVVLDGCKNISQLIQDAHQQSGNVDWSLLSEEDLVRIMREAPQLKIAEVADAQ